MIRTLKTFNFYLAALLIGISSSASAALSDREINLIFDWAQEVYPEYFPSDRPTLVSSPWRYRHWPETGVYAGERDNEIYVLGGPWGDDAPYLHRLPPPIFLTQARNAQGNDQVTGCDEAAIPNGFSITQSGNSVSITTNGVCVAMEQNTNFCETPL